MLARMWYEKTVLQQQADARLRFVPDAEARWQAAAAGWLDDRRMAVLVAQEADACVGYVVVRVEPGPPGLMPERLGVLQDMALDTHRYRGGIGRGLIAGAEDWLRGQGVQQLTVAVSRRSAVEQAFWRSLGAREWMDCLWMTF
jgi:GNAT superfamily N-acetyltransferase